jgi:hypothetical protein
MKPLCVYSLLLKIAVQVSSDLQYKSTAGVSINKITWIIAMYHNYDSMLSEIPEENEGSHYFPGIRFTPYDIIPVLSLNDY